ncbi:MAG: replicative DNA helicase [Thermoguttaceae bacterium]|nr:replicative DNA helicase [Thermoguttaceae bacterium]
MAETGPSKRPRKRITKQPPVPILDRPLPYSQEAEQGVVGAILLEPEVCDEMAVIIRPDDFFVPANRIIYRNLLDMNTSSRGIDLILLVERLREADELEEIGGEAYLAEVMSSVQVVAHARHYAMIVREKAIRRDIIVAASEVLEDGYEPGNSSQELMNRAEQKFFAIGDGRDSNRVQKIDEVMQETLQMIDRRSESGVEGVMTGFADLDKMLFGFHNSELIILAARPSMGKTALALNIADHVAVNGHQSVLFVSLEMGRVELGQRLLCSRGRIKGDHLRGGFLTSKEQQSLAKAASELGQAPLFIDDTPYHTVTEIAAVARRLKRKSEHGLAMLVIDYLGLIAPDNDQDPRQEQVAKTARRLKGLARELQIPVLCLAQLNRMTEQAKDNRPRLSHLRESGAIEQDADVVMFVHRDSYYQTAEEADDRQSDNDALVMVAKQRNGPVGDVHLTWLPDYALFANQAVGSDEEFGPMEDFGPYSSGDYQ